MESRSVASIAVDMGPVAEHGGVDIEADHSRADNLLVEALNSIANANVERVAIRALLDEYEKIEKWYA
jgi:hypothetical protein